MKKAAIVMLGMALCAAPAAHGMAQDDAAGAAAAAVDTLKERLSDKASDPQRVNDCKVPIERRDDPRRSATCGAGAQSSDDAERAASANPSPRETSPPESQ